MTPPLSQLSAQSRRRSLAEEVGRVRPRCGLQARRLATLATCALLDSVPIAVLVDLSAGCRTAFFPAGATIVRERQVDDLGVFVLARGRASVSAGGCELGMLTRGAAFGVVATLDGEARTATVRAATDVHCVVVSTAAFHELLHDEPRVARTLLLELARVLRRPSVQAVSP